MGSQLAHFYKKKTLPSSKITFMAMSLITLVLSHHAVLLLQLLVGYCSYKTIYFARDDLKPLSNDLFSTMSSGDIYERHTHTYH